MPIAARWREPRRLLMSSSFWGFGRKQAAARILPSRIITAPSWSGVLLKKMFPNNSLLGMASSIVPLSICSPSRVCRSMTISAPVDVAESSTQASQITSMVLLQTELSTLELLLNRSPSLVYPAFSRVRRSSGWKRMIRAISPMFSVSESR